MSSTVGDLKFIAGDWGTSRLRLSLCDARGGEVLDTRSGAGIASLNGRIAPAFESLAARWDEPGKKWPAVLSGMVGSTLGWRAVPYLPCPVQLESLFGDVARFESEGRSIAIAPGLTCQNRLGAPDMMRGEEVQILGAMRLEPALRHGRHLLCLPGTHVKWVSVDDGRITDFVTGCTGELFALLRDYSVLVKATPGSGEIDRSTFRMGLAQVVGHPQAELLHLVFQARSRPLEGQMNPQQASGFLSGLIVGRDTCGAVRLFADESGKVPRVTVIGAADLCELYDSALASWGLAVSRVDGERAAHAGLVTLFNVMFRSGG